MTRYSPDAVNRMRVLQGMQARQGANQGALDSDPEGLDEVALADRKLLKQAEELATRRRAQFAVVGAGQENVEQPDSAERTAGAQIGFSTGMAEQAFEDLERDLKAYSLPRAPVDIAETHLGAVRDAMRAIVGEPILRLVGRETENRLLGADVASDLEVVRGLALEHLAA